MDNFENNPQNPEQPEAPRQKESPFADSPYIMNDSQSSGAYQAPEAPSSEQPPKKKSGKRVWKGVLAVCLVVVIAAASCGITAAVVDGIWQKRSEETGHLLEQMEDKINALEEEVNDKSFTGSGNSISGTPSAAEGLTVGQVYAQNKKSVVAISNHVTTNIFGQVTEQASSGSGFIISSDGYILTNHHVIEGATKLFAITYDGTKYPATVIGSDAGNDVALIKIEASDLPAVTIGKSDDLIVGDQVVAIGNPLGQLTNTLTAGYVSAKERDVSTGNTVINMLQTDAAINPGNSGGPLFNMKGEVIGITTAKFSGTTSSGASIEGIGFAIPIDDVVKMIEELKTNGYVSKPYMGVVVRDAGNGIGVYVDGVEPEGSAAKAGIQINDIIVGLDEYEITSMNDLNRALRNFKVGDTTTIFVYRSKQVLELTITFGEKSRPTEPQNVPTASQMPVDGTAEQWYQYWQPKFENKG